jgi:hypothetical protein
MAKVLILKIPNKGMPKRADYFKVKVGKKG